ncbi:MAG: glycerate kinase [Desulfarculaceae bacterium]|nr:glycerate kinase [Desulfarculaceae bacterium]
MKEEVRKAGESEKLRHDCDRIFRAGLAAVDPVQSVYRHCTREGDLFRIDDRTFDLSRFREVVILGAGKAGAPMAAALETLLADRIARGLVVVKYGHVQPLKTVELVEAGHPVPDKNGLDGAGRILSLAEQADRDTLVIGLLSGGGSALLPLPADGVRLQDKQETTRVMLACGASIHEMNTVRKHMSAIKGGQLAAAVHPAPFACLVLSDVVGDDLDIIASGPMVPDRSTFARCMEIVERYGIEDRIPESVMTRLENGAEKKIQETPKPDDPLFERVFHSIIACSRDALEAAAKEAETLGYRPYLLSEAVQGETVKAAADHIEAARQIQQGRHSVFPPACILSGGETTVTMEIGGKGGRNQEFALKCALEIRGMDRIAVLSGGTDGTDGPTDAAGGLVDPFTVQRAEACGLDADYHLEAHDAYSLLEAVGDLYKTGPTLTNVMDLRIILVDKTGYMNV